jgi:hypothetical protein
MSGLARSEQTPAPAAKSYAQPRRSARVRIKSLARRHSELHILLASKSERLEITAKAPISRHSVRRPRRNAGKQAGRLTRHRKAESVAEGAVHYRPATSIVTSGIVFRIGFGPGVCIVPNVLFYLISAERFESVREFARIGDTCRLPARNVQRNDPIPCTGCHTSAIRG